MSNQPTIIKQAEIEKLRASLPKVGPFGEQVLARPDGSVIINQTVTASTKGKKAEQHQNQVDIFLVLEGEEEILIGGEIKDRQLVEDGEWRGEDLAGARSYGISAGDIVIIPKNIPHQHGPGTVKLLVLKIK